MGRPLMPWQRRTVDVALEVMPDGRFAYQLAIVTVPRQSGKTVMHGAVMEHRAITVPSARIWFCQQTGKDAVDWLINEHAPTLRSFGDQVLLRRAAGSEHVKWVRSEGLVRPFPPMPDSLHGKTSDLVVVDEAWAHDILRGRAIDQAIVPTQATRPNAQVWKLSTAGDDSSIWWLGTVEAGRAAVTAGRDTGVAFFEWACPDDMDPSDEASWPVYHPAYGITIGADQMRAALELLGPDEFARAYGNRWVATTARVIPLATWVARRDDEAPLPAPGEMALAFDVAIDSSDGTIVAAWRDGDAVGHVEVADHRPGTGWVAERLAELVERWRPICVAWPGAGPSIDVADRTARAGVILDGLATRDYAGACERFLRQLTDGSLRYRAHPALDDAAAAAGRRAMGDAWAWGRRQTTISISALTAATCALWAYDHAPADIGAFRIL